VKFNVILLLFYLNSFWANAPFLCGFQVLLFLVLKNKIIFDLGHWFYWIRKIFQFKSYWNDF